MLEEPESVSASVGTAVSKFWWGKGGACWADRIVSKLPASPHC